MRQRFHRLAILGFVSLMLPLTLAAQEESQPLRLGGFETQGSVSAGYRFTDFNGRREKFLELFDLRKGFRVMDFNLSGRAQPGQVPFADSYFLGVSGLGGDPFPGGQLTLRKSKLYDLRISYRQSYYYWDRNDDALLPTRLHGLTTNHDWATVRRFGSANLTVHASSNLRFMFDYQRTSRDGVNFTTRTLEYFGAAESSWGAFLRANPYYVEAPLNELASRVTGGVSYALRNWNFHYRIGYQTFEQALTWENVTSPQRSINVDAAATASELANTISWSEFRRLKTPISELSYRGKVNQRLDLRGGYIFYRYRGPATMNAAFAGSARTDFPGTNFAPYAVSWDSRARLSEPNHVADQGLTLKITEWWNLHADYRYSRFSVDSLAHFRSLRDGTTAASGEEEIEWHLGTHLADLKMEFLPTRSLIVRPGIRYLKRDVQSLADGEVDPHLTKRTKTVWPAVSVYYQPSRMFSLRADLQSITHGTSYTRITPHTDVGSRFVFRFKPTQKLSVENNMIIRDRKFRDTGFENNLRSNATTVAYAVHERFSLYGGLSYDSYFATASVTFIRGTAPRDVLWRDQTVSRVWQAGVMAQPLRNLGFNLSGNFVRTTGAGEISGEPPYFGPMTWPMATGTIYYDFPGVGRLSIDLQRTYYLEEIVRGNDFSASLLTVRWTKDF